MRNARNLLDNIEKKVEIPNKLNIFVTNFNVVKTGCLLIEILDLLGQKFEQLKVRCTNIHAKIESKVKQYMQQVQSEAEMRFLLLEKDIEDRDSLELITKLSILTLLETQFAENVVKEIWRSPYSSGNSIFTASTNFFMLFQWFHCQQDLEISSRLWNGKSVKNIGNHSMQFTVWRFAGKSRAIVDFFTTIIIAALHHYLLKKVVEADLDIVTRVDQYRLLETTYLADRTDTAAYAALQTNYDESQPVFLEFFNNMMGITWLSFVCLFFGLQYIADITYAAMTKKNFSPSSFKFFLDMLIFFVYFVFICIVFARNLKGTISEGLGVVTWDQKAVIFCRNYAENFV